MSEHLCAQIRISAMAICDGDTPPVDRQTVDKHLRACAACRAAVERLDVANLLPADIERMAVPGELWSRVRSRLAGRGTHDDAVVRRANMIPRNLQRPSWKAWWPAAICAGVLISLGVGVWLFSGDAQDGSEPSAKPTSAAQQLRENQDAPASKVDNLIVLEPLPPTKFAGEPLPPFWYESQADVIAIAVMGETKPGGEQKVIRIEIVEVLKGKQQLGPFESADGLVPFGCIMPENPQRFSDMYRAGERVAVFLQKKAGGWSTLQMTHLTGAREAPWKARVQPCLDVLLAADADDPKQRYAELLVVKDAATGKLRRGLNETAYYALLLNPDPRAAEFVREMLVALVDSPTRQEFDKLKNLYPQVFGGVSLEMLRRKNQSGPTVFPNTPRQLSALLAKMHDAPSVVPVLIHMVGLTEGERYEFIQLLPQLCQDADDDILRTVEAELIRYMAEYKGDKQHYSYRALVEVRQAIDDLRENRL